MTPAQAPKATAYLEPDGNTPVKPSTHMVRPVPVPIAADSSDLGLQVAYHGALGEREVLGAVGLRAGGEVLDDGAPDAARVEQHVDRDHGDDDRDVTVRATETPMPSRLREAPSR